MSSKHPIGSIEWLKEVDVLRDEVTQLRAIKAGLAVGSALPPTERPVPQSVKDWVTALVLRHPSAEDAFEVLPGIKLGDLRAWLG